MADHTAGGIPAPSQDTGAGPGHVDAGQSVVVETMHKPGHGPVDLGSGKIVIALQEQHAVLPARPKAEEESAEDGEDGEPEDE